VERSIYDILGSNVTNPTITNLTVVITHIDNNGHRDLITIKESLFNFAKVKAHAVDQHAQIHQRYLSDVDANDAHAQSDHRHHTNLRYQLEVLLQDVEHTLHDEANTLYKSLQQIVSGSMKDLFNTFKEFEKINEEKERVYFHFTKDQVSEAMTTFRSDLL